MPAPPPAFSSSSPPSPPPLPSPPSSSSSSTNSIAHSSFAPFLLPSSPGSDLDLFHHARYSQDSIQLFNDIHQSYPHSSPKPLHSAAAPIQLTAGHLDERTAGAESSTVNYSRMSKTRPLTFAALPFGDEDMSTTFAPGSPPDLSSSRSSTKSSSLQSSPFANDDLNDPSHFEDISLAADPPSAQVPIKTSIKTRPLLRQPLTTQTPLSSLSSPNLPDDLRAPTARNKYARNGKSPGSPRANFQRVNSSPSMAPQNFGPPSRTPSPSKSSPFIKSPTSPNRVAPPFKSYENSPVAAHRRLSWNNAKRKTAEEIEQEYHDSDEDLPEDAIVWNIPLTPRPMHTRSESNSPERPSNKTPQVTRKLKPPRSKSWTDAMGDLSAEVKALTAALESHADVSSEKDGGQHTDAPVRPILKTLRTKSMNLPVQRGHAMIDPLPVSKEKEKFLTRTRPSWLPPKCPKEERKHLKEWEAMMSSFLAAEKRRASSITKTKASLERRNSSAAQQWESKVLPNWYASIRSPDTREMWWDGIPASVRGLIWTRAIGNDLDLSFASYFAALKRASAIEMDVLGQSKENQHRTAEVASTNPGQDDNESSSKQTARMARSLRALDADIALTFASLCLFQEQCPLHQSLRNVLKAYTAYRSDTGYIRGISSVAALLLLYLSPKHVELAQAKNDSSNEKPLVVEDEAEAKSFIALSNALNKQPTLAFCLGDETAKRRFAAHVSSILRIKMPRLAEHFSRLGLHVDDWLTPTVQSLFTSLLGHVEASRIWDVLVFEGDVAFVRAVIGVLTLLEGSLYGSAKEVSDILSWNGWVSRKGEGIGMGGEKTDEESAEALMLAVRQAGRREEPG